MRLTAYKFTAFKRDMPTKAFCKEVHVDNEEAANEKEGAGGEKGGAGEEEKEGGVGESEQQQGEGDGEPASEKTEVM